MSDPRTRAWQALRGDPKSGLRLIGAASDPWSGWARGSLLLALGEFAPAFDELQAVAGGKGVPAGLAAAKVGSGLRQLDEHDAAVPWDERAVATGGVALVDGLVGLAADAVGRLDPDTADEYLSRATRRAAGWRDEVRIAWVATEIALLRDADAVRPARRAYEQAVAQDSPRHRVKSSLFLAAALQRGDPAASASYAGAGLVEARALGLTPFVWPLVSVLATPTAKDQAAAADAVRFIADRLPVGIGDRWRQRMGF